MTPRRISRRQLLQVAGSVGGSAAMYKLALGMGLMPSLADSSARPDIAPIPQGSQKVVILGAGISGLTAAYELGRKGYECIVLEASHRAGGRNLTLRRGDIVDEIGNRQVCEFDDGPHMYFNAGPARIPGNHSTLLDYCRELGVELAPFINDNRNAWVQDDNAFDGKPIRNREYVTDARGFLAELVAKGLSQHSLDAELSNDDVERLRTFVRAFGDLDENLKYRGSARAGLMNHDFTVPERLKNTHQIGELLKTSLSATALTFGEMDDQSAMMMEPVGGMDRVVQGFMNKVKDCVRLHCLVESIALRERGVDVVYSQQGRQHKIAAAYCLNSIPMQLVAGIEHNFPREYSSVFTSVPRGMLGKVGLQARERFWEREQIYGGISWTTQDITQIWYPAHGIHRQKGVILGAYLFNGPAAERFQRMSHAERIEAAIQQGSKIHPDYRRHIETGVSIAWHQMNHMLGCAAMWTPELRAQYFARLQAPVGRHYMIGDQVSYHPGWQQGAMHSALYAVAHIDRRVREEHGTKAVTV
jgi:monoamine oxidase